MKLLSFLPSTKRTRNVWVYQRELEDFFRTREAAAGVKTNFDAMRQAIASTDRSASNESAFIAPTPPYIHVHGREACAAYLGLRTRSAPAIESRNDSAFARERAPEPNCAPFATPFGVRSVGAPWTLTDSMRVKSAHSVDPRTADDHLVEYCDNKARSRSYRDTYRTLQAMPGALVAVLHLLFGDPAPGDYPPGFGDVAAIVHLTDAAEELRADMAADDSSAHMARLGVVFSEDALRARREALAEEFWRWAGKWMRFSRQHDSRIANGRLIAAADVKAKVDHARRCMRQLLDEYPRDPVVRAYTGACAQSDHEWTTRGAIRHALGFARTADGKPLKSPYELGKEKREALILRLRKDAESLRGRAMRAYGETKERLFA